MIHCHFRLMTLPALSFITASPVSGCSSDCVWLKHMSQALNFVTGGLEVIVVIPSKYVS